MRPDLRIVCRGVWLLNALLLGVLAAAAAQPSHNLADVADLSHFDRITRFARSIVGSQETLIVETRNESRTLVLHATLELPRIEIQAPAPGIGLVREGQQVARAQPLFQMDTSQLKREYALLTVELQAVEAREALSRARAWASVAKASRSQELNGTTLPESRVPEELAPLQLVVEADSAAPLVALVNVTGQVAGEVDLQNTESSWIIPLVPAASTGETIRHRLIELENRIANSQVLSPVDGVVAATSIKEGVPSVIILARQPELIVTIPISEANNVEQGTPFSFTSIAGSEPGSAVVYAVVPDETDKGRARVLARIENAKPLQVSGLTAAASLPMKIQRVASLPMNALRRDSKPARVLLLVNGIEREMEVNILNEVDGQVTVADSLENGDRVVLNPL